jgi:hypothetical protein
MGRAALEKASALSWDEAAKSALTAIHDSVR